MIKRTVLHSKLIVDDVDVNYPCIKDQEVNPHSRNKKRRIPGYLFVNVNLEAFETKMLKWSPDSLGLVGCDGEPVYTHEAKLCQMN